MKRRRWGVLLASGAFHALLVAVFVLDMDRAPVATSPPAMTVFLERPPSAVKTAPPSRGGVRARSAPATAEVSPMAPVAIPAAPAPPSPAPGVVAEAPAADLRALGGCRLATLDRLPPDERTRCQERLAQAMGGGPTPRLNLDPTGRYARGDRPYLKRPPRDGCKPVGKVEEVLLGQTAASLAIGCAKSF